MHILEIVMEFSYIERNCNDLIQTFSPGQRILQSLSRMHIASTSVHWRENSTFSHVSTPFYKISSLRDLKTCNVFSGQLIHCPNCLIIKTLFCDTLPFRTLIHFSDQCSNFKNANMNTTSQRVSREPLLTV